MFRLLPAVAALALMGCASMSTLEKSSMDSANNRIFDATQPETVKAVQASIQTLGYNLKDTKDVDGVEQVYFSKSMSAFSWGEVGRVDVSRVAEARSLVSVASEKRSQLQITGTKQQDFAKKIFRQVEIELAK